MFEGLPGVINKKSLPPTNNFHRSHKMQNSCCLRFVRQFPRTLSVLVFGSIEPEKKLGGLQPIQSKLSKHDPGFSHRNIVAASVKCRSVRGI